LLILSEYFLSLVAPSWLNWISMDTWPYSVVGSLSAPCCLSFTMVPEYNFGFLGYEVVHTWCYLCNSYSTRVRGCAQKSLVKGLGTGSDVVRIYAVPHPTKFCATPIYYIFLLYQR